MKRLLLAAITILMIAAAPAANAKSTECESQQVHVDPFSKKAAFVATERYRLTNWLGENAEFQVSTIREKDQDYLSLKVRFRKSNADEPSGDEIRNGLVIPEGRSCSSSWPTTISTLRFTRDPLKTSRWQYSAFPRAIS